MQKKRQMELLMGLLILAAAYLLAQQGAKLANRENGSRQIVVVDAGHGGSDPGKIGVHGEKEKELNLEIARKLEKELTKRGITVVMTRETDAGLYHEETDNKKVEDLQRRVEKIHETAPDCVVSIHQNSYSEEPIKGAQVFYYTDSVEGKKLAEYIQEELVRQADPANHRKAKGNNTYYLLKRTDAPLVICECGFLSNEEESKRLGEEDYQQTLVAAIADGIEKYLSGAL